MEKKRALLVNGLTIIIVLLLIAAAGLAVKLMPRKITPNAGVLEGFEPVQMTQAPHAKPSSLLPDNVQNACKEVC